jgi:hypothetical protein
MIKFGLAMSTPFSALHNRNKKRNNNKMKSRVVRPVIENIIHSSKHKHRHLLLCDTREMMRANPVNDGVCLYGMRVYGKHCMHKKNNDEYCPNTAFTDYMYCDKHLAKDLNLEVRESEHLKSMGVDGLGLYAKKTLSRLVFAAGDAIDTYRGELMNLERRRSRYQDMEDECTEYYSVSMSGTNTVIDGLCAPCAVSYSNEACDIVKLYKQTSDFTEFEKMYRRTYPKCENADMYNYGRGEYPILTATKDIYDGDEILWKYGEEYWACTRMKSAIMGPKQ